MSRKDYIEFAAMFAETRPYVAKRSTKEQRAIYELWHELRSKTMDLLQHDNLRFDRQRFITATEK